MKMNKKGFTLIELMVVILIVGILAAVAVPMMQGRIEAAKWSEANATAGTIRVAVRTLVAEKGTNLTVGDVQGALSDVTIANTLGFLGSDLEGTYFTAGDFTVSGVDNVTGMCIVTVSGTGAGLTGDKVLQLNGDWETK